VCAIGSLAVLAELWEYSWQGTDRVHWLRVLEGEWRQGETTMALTTAVAFVLCGGALALSSRWRESPTLRLLSRAAVAVVLAWGCCRLVGFAGADLCSWWPNDKNLVHPFGDPPMAFTVAVMFTCAGLGLFLLIGPFALVWRRISAVCTCSVGLLSFVALQGYSRNSWGPEKLPAPMALSDAVAFALLSAGAIAALGPQRAPLRFFVGRSARALLLCWILPVVTSLLLLLGSLRAFLRGVPAVGPGTCGGTILDALFSLGAVLTITAVLVFIARRIGKILDEARDAVEAANCALQATNQELRVARDLAESANRTKMRFLAKVNHELRTPLNAIRLYTEDLIDSIEDPAHVEDLRRMHKASLDLEGLINDILEFARLEEDRVQLIVSCFEVACLLKDAEDTVRPVVAKNGNTLEIEYGPDLGSMHSDAGRTKQCLLNLLTNANKFTRGGRIRLCVSRSVGAGGDRLTFRVQDTGRGMTPQQQALLFQPFSQVDAASPKLGGVGLGLVISRGLCRMMGGDLVLEHSAPGVGSTFTIELPVEVEPVQPPAPPVHAEPVEAGVDTGETVLVIDDDPAVRELLARYLSREGFRVVAAERGEEGLRLARELHPHAITLDVLMPGLDGWAVLSALKADPALADIPVIMMSIVADPNLAQTLGAVDSVPKPLDRQRLLGLLRRYCTTPVPGSILVVEDDTGTRSLMCRMLRAEGWHVEEAGNGREALACLGRQAPALILLDLMMPEMDGFAFMAELQRHRNWESIPVVVVTARDIRSPEQVSSGSRMVGGCVKRILRKGTFSKEELLREVRALVPPAAPAGVG
jgi:signal transduction histidine kinase/DNA-binding response OmpR family regulator